MYMVMMMMVVVMMMMMMMEISFKRYHGHYADIFIDTPKKSTQSMMNGRLPNILIIGHSHFSPFSLPIIYSLFFVLSLSIIISCFLSFGQGPAHPLLGSSNRRAV